MSDRVRRLRRLHGIRKMQADVEENVLRRLQGEANLLGRRTMELRENIVGRNLYPPPHNQVAHEWQLLAAERALFGHHLDFTLKVVECLAGSVQEQQARFQHASRDKEQMHRLADKAKIAHAQDKARQEQQMLDDLFAGRRSTQGSLDPSRL